MCHVVVQDCNLWVSRMLSETGLYHVIINDCDLIHMYFVQAHYRNYNGVSKDGYNYDGPLLAFWPNVK